MSNRGTFIVIVLINAGPETLFVFKQLTGTLCCTFRKLSIDCFCFSIITMDSIVDICNNTSFLFFSKEIYTDKNSMTNLRIERFKKTSVS